LLALVSPEATSGAPLVDCGVSITEEPEEAGRLGAGALHERRGAVDGDAVSVAPDRGEIGGVASTYAPPSLASSEDFCRGAT